MIEEHTEQPRRKTEQGDELSDEHMIGPQHGRPENPYRPARQPAQQQPDEDEDERDTGF